MPRRITRRAIAGALASAALAAGLIATVGSASSAHPSHVADSVWGVAPPEPTPAPDPSPTATLADSVWG